MDNIWFTIVDDDGNDVFNFFHDNRHDAIRDAEQASVEQRRSMHVLRVVRVKSFEHKKPKEQTEGGDET